MWAGVAGRLRRYTRAMKSALRAMEAQEASAQVMEPGWRASDGWRRRLESKVEPPALAERSKIGAMIAAGEFVTLVEIVSAEGD